MQPKLPQNLPPILASYNLQLEPTLYPPRRNERTSPRRHGYPTKDLQVQKVPMIIRKQRAPNWVPRQPSKRNTKEYRPVPHPDFSNGGDLGHE